MYSTPNSDFDDFASSPVAATSHSDQDDDDPSSFTASVVLFKGPDVSLFPAVGRHIASGLAASSSPAPKLLKTLDGAQFELPPHDLSYYEDGWLVTTKWSSIKYGGGEWNEWRINHYETNKRPVKRQSRGWHSLNIPDWDTVEIPRLKCSQPPAAPLDLFAGVVAAFRDDQTFAYVLTGQAAAQHLMQPIKDVFVAFGGTITDKLTAETTHDVSRNVLQSSTPDHRTLHTVHPNWISLSVSLGALVPASLFEMGHSHPVTSLSKQRYRGTNETKEGFLGPVRTYGVHSTHSDFPTSLLGVVGLVIDKLQPPSTRPVPSFIGRRLYLDISATPEGRRGAPPQLAEAVAAFVGRSGARVVTDVRAADWLVVSERSGDAYWHGLRSPNKVMGTLQHLLAHLNRTETEPIDPRSNMLYFPLPSIADLEAACIPPIYISAHYPEVYRQYLAGLVKVLDPLQRPLEPPKGEVHKRHVVISPADEELHPEDENDLAVSPIGTRLLPKYLEDSLLLCASGPIFDLESESFNRDELECFPPEWLPKDFHLQTHEPRTVDDEVYRKLGDDLEAKFKHVSSRMSLDRLCACSTCSGSAQ